MRPARVGSAPCRPPAQPPRHRTGRYLPNVCSKRAIPAPNAPAPAASSTPRFRQGTRSRSRAESGPRQTRPGGPSRRSRVGRPRDRCLGGPRGIGDSRWTIPSPPTIAPLSPRPGARAAAAESTQSNTSFARAHGAKPAHTANSESVRGPKCHRRRRIVARSGGGKSPLEIVARNRRACASFFGCPVCQ